MIMIMILHRFNSDSAVGCMGFDYNKQTRGAFEPSLLPIEGSMACMRFAALVPLRLYSRAISGALRATDRGDLVVRESGPGCTAAVSNCRPNPRSTWMKIDGCPCVGGAVAAAW